MNASTSAAGLTVAMHTMLAGVTSLAQERRHLWLDMQAEGHTYASMAHGSDVSEKTVKTQLALARTERENGTWPGS